MSYILIMCPPREVGRAGPTGRDEVYTILHAENMSTLFCSIGDFQPSCVHYSCFDTTE